jgi:hypothetical protein
MTTRLVSGMAGERLRAIMGRRWRAIMGPRSDNIGRKALQADGNS